MVNQNKASSKSRNKNKINKKRDRNTDNKINLKRGKLPSNWNSFIENNKATNTTKIVAQKYPKSLKETADLITKESNSNKVKNSVTANTYIAMDCEMVGINENGRDHMLARVSIVDENGSVIYDTFVKPTQQVVDYRTNVSGVRPEDVANGRDFKTVQNEVNSILHGKVLVGHALKNDLGVLYLNHNKHYIRDTSKLKKFREHTDGRTPSLKFLASKYLGLEIQTAEHSSVEDARAAMFLYKKFKDVCDSELIMKKSKP